jgi:hypothetical protein
MKKLVIELTDEQYYSITKLMAQDAKVNFEEETNAGYSFTLDCAEGDLCSLIVKANNKIELEDIVWRFE